MSSKNPPADDAPEKKGNSIDMEDSKFTAAFLKKLTPRSKAACKMHGVLPSELVVRPFESFHKPGTSSKIAKLRYQEYESLRQETIEIVRGQRKDLLQTGWHKRSSNNKPSQGMKRATSAASNGSKTKDEMEQRRIEQIMARQNKELEAMMAYEVKMANMLAKQEQKLQARREREAKEREARKHERYKIAEKHRMWQLAKAEDEAREREKNDLLAKRVYEQEQRYLAEQKEKERQRRREVQRKQEERLRKKEELQRRTQMILEQQHQQVLDKSLQMQKRDAQRAAAIAQAKKEIAAAHAEKARSAQQRVKTVLDANDRQLEQKRLLLNTKMAEQAHRMEEFKEELAQEKRAKKKAAREREEKRLQGLMEAKKQQQAKVREYLKRERMLEEQKADMDRKAREDHELRQELHRLNMLRKHQNLERLQRVEEMKRKDTLKKITEETKRTQEREMRQRALLVERQRNQIVLQKQKKELMEMFSTLKSTKNWKQLSKINVASELAKSASTGKLRPVKRGRTLQGSKSQKQFSSTSR